MRRAARSGALSFWAPLILLCAVMYAVLMVQFANLPPDLAENSNDLKIYRETGEALLRGKVPYRDFFIEYPPASLPAFVPPALFSNGTPGYVKLFANEMALALAASLALAALTARRLWGSKAWLVPALTFGVSAILLYPVAVTRYDAVVALTLAVAVYGTARGGRYVPLAYAALGFGAAAKLVPALAALPLAFARRGRAVSGFVVFSLAVALFFVPAVLLGGSQFEKSFAYHAQRGLQVESVWSSVLMSFGWIEQIVFDFGAFEVRGRGVDLATSLSLPVTGALLLVTALGMYREYRAGRFGAGQFPRYAAALILAFMIGSKVLSPQYMIWLLPLVPLSISGLAGVGISLLFVANCWTTTQIFPIHYGDLLNLQSPGPGLLLARNVLLVCMWGFMLLMPASGSAGKEEA